MRRHARRFVVLLLVLALTAGLGMVARDLLQQRSAELALEAIELLPEVAQRIQNFHRVRIDGERKVWEVSAREAQYFEDRGVVAVSQPQVSVFLDEGREVELRGSEGRVFLEGKELTRVEVDGEIDVQWGEYSLRSRSAHYEVAGDRIVVPGAVHVAGTELEFDGEGMVVDLQQRRMTVNKNVRMKLWPHR